jgi:hypothetical protein
MPTNNQLSDNTGNMGKTDETGGAPSNDHISGAEKWLDEHGNPNYSYLESLAGEGTPESLEALKAIADEHNVNYEADDTAQVLIDKIVFAMKKEDGDESM